MAGIGNTLSNDMLDATIGSTDYAATLYFGLSTAVTSHGSGAVEPTDDTYARVAVTNNDTNFPAASTRVKTVHPAINFDAMTAEVTGVREVIMCDAETGGNVLYAWSISGAPITIPAGVRATFNGDTMTLTLG